MQFLQVLISGISQGCIYGLIALGFVLIYKATEAVNFAQAELMMLGAFCGLAASGYFGLPYWMVLLVAMAVLAGFGFLTERLVLRPILGQPAFAIVMVTIGVGYTARGLITMIPGIGTDTHTISVLFKDQVLQMGGLIIGMEHVVIIVTSVVLCGALFLLFRHTASASPCRRRRKINSPPTTWAYP